MRRSQFLRDIEKLDSVKQELATCSANSNRAITLKSHIHDVETHKSMYEYILAIAPFVKSYCSINNVKEEQTPYTKTKPNNASLITNTFVKITPKIKRGMIFAEYMDQVEKDPSYNNLYRSEVAGDQQIENDICKACGTFEWDYFDSEGSRSCRVCGHNENFHHSDLTNLTYKEEVEQNSHYQHFAYKRINHFTDWLKSLECKTNVDIPSEVISAVRYELKKLRIVDMSKITSQLIRQLLKKQRLNKYYEHVNAIKCEITDKQTTILDEAVKDNLRKMFIQIQEPFNLYKPPNRKNFLSYSYVIYKSLQLLGHDDLLVHFSLLKSREKLYAQDLMWRLICKHLHWQFIKSV